MEKNGYKVIAVVALIMAVVALSVGFASFSATLSITNAQATIQPADNVQLNVHYQTSSVNCSGTGTATVGNLTGNPAIVWDGLSATLKHGQSVTCTAVIQNESVYEAFLTSIEFEAPNGGVNRLDCNSTNNDIQNMPAACDAITVTVRPASSWVPTNPPTATVTAATSSNPTPAMGIAGISIPASTTKTVELVIAYSSASSTAIADDTFTVTIPKIKFNFNTQDINAS